MNVPKMTRGRASTMSYIVSIALLAILGSAAAKDKDVVVYFTRGAKIENLPGAAILNPMKAGKPQRVVGIKITLTNVTYIGPNRRGSLIKYINPGYVDDNTGKSAMFGPTIRVPRASLYNIKLTNNLVQQTPVGEVNWFHNLGNTNMHTHGMHAETGVMSQDTASNYVFGDNPFFTLEGKETPASTPKSINFGLAVPPTHMPGLHWYHPHQHGSTSTQVTMSHGAIVIEDDNPVWLPPGTGCEHVAALFDAAEERILDITLLYFKTPYKKRTTPPTPAEASSDELDMIDNPNYQYISTNATPPSTLCCGPGQISGSALTAVDSEGRVGEDILLMNGGLEPVITLEGDKWQRWRILFSGIKGFFVLRIVDEKTGQPAPQCELQLYAKDGVYLMNMPRPVTAMLLASASRAEVLVRCTNVKAGQKFTLTARDPGPFSDNDWADVPGAPGRYHHLYLRQEVVATIKISKKSPKKPPGPTDPDYLLYQPLVARACTPKRPAYATDLRDAALVAAGFNPANVYSYEVAFNAQEYPAAPGVPNAVACKVNNKTFTLPDPDPLVLPLGKVVQWNFTDVEFHPMHNHINPHQIQFLDPAALAPGNRYTDYFEAGDWHDTLTLPMRFQLLEPKTPLRYQPGEFAGYTLMHCHFLNHEDIGCMKVVLYQCPGYNDTQPVVCNFQFPIPGTAIV